MKWIRHGDVIIEKVDNIPSGKRKKVELLVLAEGEVTGHKHIIRGECILVTETKDSKYIELVNESKLTHEEHNELNISSGKYKVYLQREVDLLGELRNVSD